MRSAEALDWALAVGVHALCLWVVKQSEIICRYAAEWTTKYPKRFSQKISARYCNSFASNGVLDALDNK